MKSMFREGELFLLGQPFFLTRDEIYYSLVPGSKI